MGEPLVKSGAFMAHRSRPVFQHPPRRGKANQAPWTLSGASTRAVGFRTRTTRSAPSWLHRKTRLRSIRHRPSLPPSDDLATIPAAARDLRFLFGHAARGVPGTTGLWRQSLLLAAGERPRPGPLLRGKAGRLRTRDGRGHADDPPLPGGRGLHCGGRHDRPHALLPGAGPCLEGVRRGLLEPLPLSPGSDQREQPPATARRAIAKNGPFGPTASPRPRSSSPR